MTGLKFVIKTRIFGCVGANPDPSPESCLSGHAAPRIAHFRRKSSVTSLFFCIALRSVTSGLFFGENEKNSAPSAPASVNSVVKKITRHCTSVVLKKNIRATIGVLGNRMDR